MSAPTKTLYRVEARPMILTPWRRVPVWDPVARRYRTWTLKRGKWYTAWNRERDGRAVFGPERGARRLVGPRVAEKMARSLRRHGFAVRKIPVDVALYPHLTGDLDAGKVVLSRLERLADRIGRDIHVLSGGRTLEEQQHLWDLYQAGIGNLAAEPNPYAPHIRGAAADAYVDWVPLRSWLVQHGRQSDAVEAKLHFPVAGEAWHVEAVGE